MIEIKLSEFLSDPVSAHAKYQKQFRSAIKNTRRDLARQKRKSRNLGRQVKDMQKAIRGVYWKSTGERLEKGKEMEWAVGLAKVEDEGITNTDAENEILRRQLDGAIDRIYDLLLRDDGQAYKEAEKFIGDVERNKRMTLAGLKQKTLKNPKVKAEYDRLNNE